jgi:hypothetical protein
MTGSGRITGLSLLFAFMVPHFSYQAADLEIGLTS